MINNWRIQALKPFSIYVQSQAIEVQTERVQVMKAKVAAGQVPLAA